MAEWAADESKPWEELEFDQYGLHATLEVKTIRALYYKAGKDRLLTIVLVRDTAGGPARPDVLLHADWTGTRGRSCRITRRWSVETCQADSTSSDRWCGPPADRLPSTSTALLELAAWCRQRLTEPPGETACPTTTRRTAPPRP